MLGIDSLIMALTVSLKRSINPSAGNNILTRIALITDETLTADVNGMISGASIIHVNIHKPLPGVLLYLAQVYTIEPFPP